MPTLDDPTLSQDPNLGGTGTGTVNVTPTPTSTPTSTPTTTSTSTSVDPGGLDPSVTQPLVNVTPTPTSTVTPTSGFGGVDPGVVGPSPSDPSTGGLAASQIGTKTVSLTNILLGPSITSVKVYYDSVSSGTYLTTLQRSQVASGTYTLTNVPEDAVSIILQDTGFCATEVVVTIQEVSVTPTPTITPTTTPTPTTTLSTGICADAYWCKDSGQTYPMTISVTSTTGRFVNGTGSPVQVFIRATSYNTGACNVVLKNSFNTIVAGASGTFNTPGQYIYSSPVSISSGASLTYTLAQNGANASGLQVQLIYGPTTNPSDASPLDYQSPECCVFETPTPTVTPSSTPQCLTYDILNASMVDSLTVEFTNCSGVTDTFTILPDSDYYVCAQSAPYRISGSNSYTISAGYSDPLCS